MQEVELGTIGKIKNRNLTPEQKQTLEVTKAIDYLFESIINGYTYSVNEKTLDYHAKIFLKSIRDKFLNLDEFKNTIYDRICYHEGSYDRIRYHEGSKEEKVKLLDKVIEILKIPREDLPLFINDTNNIITAIANARIRYGED